MRRRLKKNEVLYAAPVPEGQQRTSRIQTDDETVQVSSKLLFTELDRPHDELLQIRVWGLAHDADGQPQWLQLVLDLDGHMVVTTRARTEAEAWKLAEAQLVRDGYYSE